MTNQPLPPEADVQDGDFETDQDGLIKRVDRHACGLIGLPESTLLGMPLRDLIAAGQETLLAEDRRRMANQNVIRTEWRMRRGDGREFTAEVIARGLGAEAMRFIARDATRVKAAYLAQARLAAIVESSDDAIISKTLSGIVMTWNRAAERIFGYSSDEMVGRSIRRLIPADRESEEDEFLARIARGQRVQSVETVRHHKDGSPVLVDVTVSPIFSDDGGIIGASTIARDVRGIYEARAQLRESDERFRTLADNISQLAWMADSKGWIFWYNKRWYDYTGTTLEEMQGWGWKKAHHPDHVDRVVTRIQQSWDSGEPWEDTFPLRGTDGEYRWFLSRALPIRDETGRIVRWFGTNTDVTEQKRREEQIRLLMREVNHRSKNLLALVQAIARQTEATAADDFVARFLERIQGLSASNDLLVQSGWRGVGIVDLVRIQLAHFADLIGTRILLDGPDLVVTSAAAQAIGMVLHELGTNAGKYGALSDDVGTVDIAWHERGDGEDREFVIRWQESGGPAVVPPTRQGFGSVVIEKMVAVSLAATSELSFVPTGVAWRLEGPSNKIVAERRRAGQTAANGPPSARNRPLRIMVVEDDPKRALSLLEQLQSAHHHAIGPAVTIDEAFALLGEERLDCAVLGPGLDTRIGTTLINRLDELALPYFVLPAHDQRPTPTDTRSADTALVALDTRELLATLEHICYDRFAMRAD